MSTERLYYHDSFLKEFEAQVVRCEPAPQPQLSSSAWRVTLDRTAFYPTSGGQPHDTGRLGDSNVLEVVDEGDSIVHVTDRACAEGAVHGAIDWARRFDHMQQHTGQHLLSAVCLAQLGFPTVSFHLGKESATIDLQGAEPTAAQLRRVEDYVNSVIFEDRAVNIRFGTPEELAAAGIRKTVEREGVLRAIEIEGEDLTPCGGTHLARTGQIGLLLLRKRERMKQNWRVEFVCGGRALRAARADYKTIEEIAGRLTCSAEDLPAMVGRIVNERDTQYRARRAISEQLAEAEARLALSENASGARGRVICRVFEEADAEFLRAFASKVVTQGDIVVLAASRQGGHLLFAQPKGGKRDMNTLLRGVLTGHAGKGGGTADLAQGRLENVNEVADALKSAAERLEA